MMGKRGRKSQAKHRLTQFHRKKTIKSVINEKGKKVKVPSIGPGADPGVQAVSPQVT